MRLTHEERSAAPPFWDCPDCGWELDWHEETITWCDQCGAEWQYGTAGNDMAFGYESELRTMLTERKVTK